jgi:hypothetical protein
MKTKQIPILLLLLLAVSCASIFSGVVTITTVVDTAMKSWADLSVKGLTTEAVDTKVKQVHEKYRASCAVAQTALVAYKASGDPTSYNAAVAAAKQAANQLVDLIVPLLSASNGTDLKTKLANAKTL